MMHIHYFFLLVWNWMGALPSPGTIDKETPPLLPIITHLDLKPSKTRIRSNSPVTISLRLRPEPPKTYAFLFPVLLERFRPSPATVSLQYFQDDVISDVIAHTSVESVSFIGTGNAQYEAVIPAFTANSIIRYRCLIHFFELNIALLIIIVVIGLISSHSNGVES